MADNCLKDCHQELKRLHNLQYESDFNDEIKEANFYKERADSIQELINQGVEYIPNF
tara:strand:+ start:83 stop:253 length:171 start_codon:yes stop_codon:yes gene_type:complete